MKKTVPRIVHQTWKTLEVPERWKSSQIEWKKLHPDWEYRLWSDADLRNLILSDYSWFIPTYDSFKHNIQRVDVARSFILHKYGGVYSDLDIVPVRSFENFVSYFENDETTFTVALVETPNSMLGYILSNYLMLGVPGSPFWDYYWKWLKNKEWEKEFPWYMRMLMRQRHYAVLFSTGPTALSRVWQIAMKQEQNKNTMVMMIPCALATNGTKSYNKHMKNKALNLALNTFEELEGGSWCGDSTQNANNGLWLYDNRDSFVFPLIFILIIVIIVLSCFLAKK